jgi:hypothetical protein
MKRESFVFFCSILFLLITLSSCQQKEAVHWNEEFLIKVDSIHCPAQLQVGQTLDIQFFGIAGYNGCSGFKRFVVSKHDSVYSIQVVGERKMGKNLNCTDAIQYLNDKKVSLLQDSSGVIKIEVINPGLNQVISKQVEVVL